MQIEQTGTAARFDIRPEPGFLYYIDSISFTFIDAIDTTLANASMPNLSYNQILGMGKLSTGIGFTTVRGGDTEFSAFITCLADSTRAGGEVINAFADATNAHVTLRTNFPTPSGDSWN